MNVFYCENIQQPVSVLNQQESHHCSRVLRMQVGNELLLIDGKGTKAVGKIQQLNKKEVQVEIVELTKEDEPKEHLHIAIAPTKTNERIEWFLEKATELNCSEITLFTSFHSERKKINFERFEKQLMTACKQSKRAFFPKLNVLTTFKEFVQQPTEAQKFIATLHPTENAFSVFKSAANSIVLIGPEGGFSQQEVDLALEQGYQPMLLGKQRLRTETAGVFAVSVFYTQWSC